MTWRRRVVATHRWIGIVAALLWLLQAVTGVFAVFHWEIEDAMTAGAHRPTDWKAIESRLRHFAPYSMWSTAGAPDRYDVNVPGRALRIDGAGNVLRVRRDGESGFADTIVVLHQSLLAGDRGRWVIGASGLFLASNLILGIIAAWPRRGQWKRAVRPLTAGSRVATLYSWHRAAGLWLAIPGLCIVTAGVLLAFDDVTESLLHPGPDDPPPIPASAPRIGFAQAVGAALSRYPGAALSGVGFPSSGNATWKVTLRQRGELQRAYGRTRVFVSAVDGHVVADFDALTAPSTRRFLDLVFPFHTGEMGGLAGRLAVMTIGLWLITMIVLGIALWRARRPATSSSATPGTPRPSSGR